MYYTLDTSSIAFAGFTLSHLLACRKDHGRRQSGGWGKERPSRFPCALNEQFVHDNKGRHSFNDRNSTWNNTGVVTAPCGKCTWCAIILSCFLRPRYGRRRLESDPMIRGTINIKVAQEQPDIVHRKYISSPFVIPPWTPPLQLVDVPRLPSSRRTKRSLCLLPGTSVPRKPDPISNALVAGMDNIACPSLASNLSKTGSPSPAGTLRMTQVTVPPIES